MAQEGGVTHRKKISIEKNFLIFFKKKSPFFFREKLRKTFRKKSVTDKFPANHTIPARLSPGCYSSDRLRTNPPLRRTPSKVYLQDSTKNVRTAVDTNWLKRTPDERICTIPAGGSPNLCLTPLEIGFVAARGESPVVSYDVHYTAAPGRGPGVHDQSDA